MALPEATHLLITGGCGFMGSNLVRHVLAHRPSWRVTNLDALTYAGNPANLADIADNPRYRFVHGSVCDRSVLGPLVAQCDAVAHLAAQTHVDRSLADGPLFVQTNVLGTETLLECIREATGPATRGPRLLHVSTDEVYGHLPLDRPDLRFREDDPLRPRNPYSASKAGADLLVQAYGATFRLDAVIARSANNLGPYQYPEKVIPRFVTNLAEGQPVPLYGDGRNVRDWLHVDDFCEAAVRLLEAGRPGEAYNIGADNERSNLELTHAILGIMGRDERMIEHVADRPGHDLRYALDTAKARRELGWQPTRSGWPAALERTVRWYLDHEAWWRPLRPGGAADPSATS
jgi:dTDP-glucose 4,6-dehydratase